MIKKFNNFNEAISSDVTITMDDVRKMKHNMDYDGEDFLQNYCWEEDQILIASPSYNKPVMWGDKEVQILDLYSKDDEYNIELGYAISINGNIKYLIDIDEPRGCSINVKRGLVTAHGHEDIIKLWLDDGEFERTHTR